MSWNGTPAEFQWYERVGRLLRQERKRRGWTVYDVGAAIGVTAAAISRWENGHDRMKAYQYDRLRHEGLLP